MELTMPPHVGYLYNVVCKDVYFVVLTTISDFSITDLR